MRAGGEQEEELRVRRLLVELKLLAVVSEVELRKSRLRDWFLFMEEENWERSRAGFFDSRCCGPLCCGPFPAIAPYPSPLLDSSLSLSSALLILLLSSASTSLLLFESFADRALRAE